MPPEQDDSYQAPVVYVGTPVQWLPNGQPNDTPVPAVVGAPQQSHGLCLLVLKLKDRPKRIEGVMHIDDPRHTQRSHEAQMARGAWRLIPGLVPKQERPLSETDKKALRLLDEGKTPSEVAMILSEEGEPWNHQRVNQLVKRNERRLRIESGAG